MHLGRHKSIISAIQSPRMVLDFNKPFTIESDATDITSGAGLSHNQNPIAFLSKSMSPKNQAMLVCDKEMLAIVFVVQHWRPYPTGYQFKIILGHSTVKYFLDQRIMTPMQEKWLLKLLGYNYVLETMS